MKSKFLTIKNYTDEKQFGEYLHIKVLFNFCNSL